MMPQDNDLLTIRNTPYSKLIGMDQFDAPPLANTSSDPADNVTSSAPAGIDAGSQSLIFSDAHAKAIPPTSVMPPDNTKGRGVIIYVNGSFSDHTAWTPQFVGAVNKTYSPVHQETFDWDRSGVGQGQSGMAMSDIKGNAPSALADKISEMRDRYPGQPVW